MNEFKGKKIVILGGTPQHCKLVRVAKEMGLYTIVTDYLPNSAAKKISDESYELNIMDVDAIVQMCREEKVDGVISGYIDPCQRPYYQICEKLGLPCYGTAEQFFKMTDKHAFKEMCELNNVDVIPEYFEEDIAAGKVEYPVFVKPVDSRGSRGQSVCYNEKELKKAIDFAKSESSNGDILIEKYMKNAHEFQVTYFFVDGDPYLIRTVDSYCGEEKHHLEKVVACAVSPSRFTDLYLKNTHERVIKMFKNLGIKNGPIFMQGFEDEGVFRFFDPGLRFPGVDYEMVYKAVYGIDIMRAMIQIALTGNCKGFILPDDGVWIKGKRAAVLFPTVKAGVVAKLEGEEEIRENENVISFLPRCEVGDVIEWAYNVNQRSAEIDVIGENTEELKKVIRKVQDIFIVRDSDGNDMTFEKFPVDTII